MDAQSIFKIVVVLYSVSNLLSLGIELNLKLKKWMNQF